MRKAWKRLAVRAAAVAGLWVGGVLAGWSSLALTAGPNGLALAGAAGFLAGVSLGCFCGAIATSVVVGDALVDVWDARMD